MQIRWYIWMNRIIINRTTEGSIVHKFNPFIFESQKAHNKRLANYSKKWNMENLDTFFSTGLVECACSDVYKTRLLKKTGRTRKIEFIRQVGEDNEFIEAYHNANLNDLSIHKRIIAKFLSKKYFNLLSFLFSICYVLEK